jgi:hypothetical protein
MRKVKNDCIAAARITTKDDLKAREPGGCECDLPRALTDDNSGTPAHAGHTAGRTVSASQR